LSKEINQKQKKQMDAKIELCWWHLSQQQQQQQQQQ